MLGTHGQVPRLTQCIYAKGDAVPLETSMKGREPSRTDPSRLADGRHVMLMRRLGFTSKDVHW